MRLYFPNPTRPKKAAKTIASLTRRSLSVCQRAVAIACGYRDWHEMEGNFSSNNVSDLDEILSRDMFIERYINLSTSLGDELRINFGDALYFLRSSRLTGNRKPDTSELLDIRIKLFRENGLPVVAVRSPGAVGRLKSPSRNGEIVILRRLGKPTRIITNKSVNAIVADFEYITPRSPLPLFIPMRLYLAYGVWKENDGANVLFSRDYCPLWRIREGKKPERLEPWQKIKFVDQQWFWGDENAPWKDHGSYRIEIRRLEKYELAGLPFLVEVLPIIVFRDDVHSIKDAVNFLMEIQVRLSYA